MLGQRDPRSEGNVRVLPAAQSAPPDPQVIEKARRRTFSNEYKWQIVRAAEVCAHGELGAMLRREGLTYDQLRTWRKQFSRAEEVLQSTVDQGKVNLSEAEKRIAELERQKKQLERELHHAHAIIEVQKKISEILQIPLNPPQSDESD